MRRLRRRTREGVEVWVYGWVEEWVRAPFYFINSGLIPDRRRYCTYLYYLRVGYLYDQDRASNNWSCMLICATVSPIRLAVAGDLTSGGICGSRPRGPLAGGSIGSGGVGTPVGLSGPRNVSAWGCTGAMPAF
jgi:hypothetical protein